MSNVGDTDECVEVKTQSISFTIQKWFFVDVKTRRRICYAVNGNVSREFKRFLSFISAAQSIYCDSEHLMRFVQRENSGQRGRTFTIDYIRMGDHIGREKSMKTPSENISKKIVHFIFGSEIIEIGTTHYSFGGDTGGTKRMPQINWIDS